MSTKLDNLTQAQTAQPAPMAAHHLLQRKCACGQHTIAGSECDACNKKRLQRRAANQVETEEAPPIVHEVLRSTGQPLDVETRSFMESRFHQDFSHVPVHALAPQRSGDAMTVGEANDFHEQEADRVAERVMRVEPQSSVPRAGLDFSRVRVHTDARAAESARAVGALAYTVGNNLVFGAGQYAPNSLAGRKLLAHELAHTIQQGEGRGSHALQRACDDALLSARTAPVFFPNLTGIKHVFEGKSTLNTGTTYFAAVGLVQQALVDLGFNLGTSGPNKDGVDRQYGKEMKKAVSDFQIFHAPTGAKAGVVDQPTLKCLDEVRSHQTVPVPQAATVPEEQFQIGGEGTSADNEIFFKRGSAVLDVGDKTRIKKLATDHQGCALELKGFISEDERVDFGDQLANDRLNAVSAEFAKNDHDKAGVCTPPTPLLSPLRKLTPLPEASSGKPKYRDRRMVEVVPPGATPVTVSCDKKSVRQRPLDAVETPVFDKALADSLPLMQTAIDHLVEGDADGDKALKDFFNSESQRDTVKKKLVKWRDHIDKIVRKRKQRGTECDADCEDTIAYNHKTGASAMMTLCEDFFGTMGLYPKLNDDQKRAVVLIHEAGHGSLDTDDIAYDTGRLVNFIARTPALALKNTDSFVTLVQCLAKLPDGCVLPAPADKPINITDADQLKNAKEGLAWLDTWLTWAGQDVSGLYTAMSKAREKGRWRPADDYFSESVLPPLAEAFKMHRPDFKALPTFREQTEVAAIWERVRQMSAVAGGDLEIEKDTSATPVQRWKPGVGRPGDKLFLTDSYFALTTPRERVEALLPLIVEATTLIAPGLRTAYVEFIKTTVKDNWNNRP